MIPLLRHGLDIYPHHWKGVYVCAMGKNSKHARGTSTEAICTLREGHCEDDFDDVEGGGSSGSGDADGKQGRHAPLTLSCQDTHVTLRPWNPYQCIIAAAICNRLIHFPIRSGSGVLAIGCSLQTLSHFSDILGPEGQLIGVIDEFHGERPSSAALRKFFRAHPRVHVMVDDVMTASLARYERYLSLPLCSKHAFLMGLHRRLGASSPIGVLNSAPSSETLVKHIFSFLEFGEPPDIRCLVIFHCPSGTRMDALRSLALSQMDIVQRWRSSAKTSDKAPKKMERPDPDSDSDGEDGPNRDQDDPDGPDGDKSASAPDTRGDSGTRSRSKDQSTRQWVFLDLPLENLAIDTPNASVSSKMLEVVSALKRLRSGLRTGLLAKEQLFLMPFFPNHALLLLKYLTHRDSSGKKSSTKRAVGPPMPMASGSSAEHVDASPPASSSSAPPMASIMPVPSFGGRFQVEMKPPPGLEPVPEPPGRPVERAATGPPAPTASGWSAVPPPPMAPPVPFPPPAAPPPAPPPNPRLGFQGGAPQRAARESDHMLPPGLVGSGLPLGAAAASSFSEMLGVSMPPPPHIISHVGGQGSHSTPGSRGGARAGGGAAAGGGTAPGAGGGAAAAAYTAGPIRPGLVEHHGVPASVTVAPPSLDALQSALAAVVAQANASRAAQHQHQHQPQQHQQPHSHWGAPQDFGNALQPPGYWEGISSEHTVAAPSQGLAAPHSRGAGRAAHYAGNAAPGFAGLDANGPVTDVMPTTNQSWASPGDLGAAFPMLNPRQLQELMDQLQHQRVSF